MGKLINLRRNVEYASLEKALTKAAKEVGWKIQFKDKSEEGYSRTDVILRGTIRKKMEVSIFDKISVAQFYVYFGDTINGNASKSQAKEYLRAVHKYLQEPQDVQ